MGGPGRAAERDRGVNWYGVVGILMLLVAMVATYTGITWMVRLLVGG